MGDKLSSKKYKGTLELNWINKDKSLIYEYDEDGNPTKPQWVERDDIRVSEPRILTLKGEYCDPNNENMLIKGDNLLALRTLVEEFKNREEKDKVKCTYIDPPYNTGNAFEDYEDNLEKSEWLTLMRDRLILLKKLMSSSGVIIVQINHINLGRLKCLLDEIFGPNNFVQIVTVETSDPSGHAIVNPGLYDASEFILIYARNKKLVDENKDIRVPIAHDFGYNKIILNIDDTYSNWIMDNVQNQVAKNLGFNSVKDVKKRLGKQGFNTEVADFALKNAKRVFQSTAISDKAGKKIVELRDKSKEDDKVHYFKRENHYDVYIHKGREIYFYSKKVRKIDGKLTATKPLTNIWQDISWNGIAREGGVKLKRGKKPEKLIKRIFQIYSVEGDLVLDSFLGSGTTAAVAHKIGRRWIGIEIGKHAETHCLKRLKNVIDESNPDTTGISKDGDVDWKGGGGFRYYVLGDSLIKDHDINWGLEQEDIARALFMNFDYGFNGSLGDGVFVGRRGHRYGLCLVSKNVKIVCAKRIGELIEQVNEKFDDLADLEIYTNMGVGVRREDLPENVTVKKIPESILRKYKL